MNVAAAADSTCDTGMVRSLTAQLFTSVNHLRPGLLAPVAHPRIVAASRVTLVLQHPAADALHRALDAAPASLGRFEIVSAWRSCVQQWMVVKWKAQNRCGVPKASPVGTSRHEVGLALDIGRAKRSLWMAHLAHYGFVALGPSDPPHTTYHGPGAVLDAGKVGVQAFQALHNQFNPGALLAVDGEAGPATLAAIAAAPAMGWAPAPAPAPACRLVVDGTERPGPLVDDGQGHWLLHGSDGKEMQVRAICTGFAFAEPVYQPGTPPAVLVRTH